MQLTHENPDEEEKKQAVDYYEEQFEQEYKFFV